jgi:hypothetical protein
MTYPCRLLIAHAVSSKREHMGWRREIRERIAELEQQRLQLEEQRRRARRLDSPEGERWAKRFPKRRPKRWRTPVVWVGIWRGGWLQTAKP